MGLGLLEGLCRHFLGRIVYGVYVRLVKYKNIIMDNIGKKWS